MSVPLAAFSAESAECSGGGVSAGVGNAGGAGNGIGMTDNGTVKEIVPEMPVNADVPAVRHAVIDLKVEGIGFNVIVIGAGIEIVVGKVPLNAGGGSKRENDVSESD